MFAPLLILSIDRVRPAAVSRVGLTALIATLVALAASGCSGEEATPTSTAASPTSEVGATAEAPSATTTAITPPRPLIPDLGVWVIDAETAEIVKLYELDDAPTRERAEPIFAPSGAVWVTDDDGAARRYLADGTVTESVSDGVVFETIDPAARAVLSDDGALHLDVDGQREAMGDAVIAPFVSPTGVAVAYLERVGEASVDLLVAVPGGEPIVLAAGVQLCACDDAPAPAWSPSGEFIAFSDFGGASDGEDDRGTYVVPVDGGESPTQVVADPRALLGWVASDDATLAIQVVSEPRLFDAASRESRPLMAPGQVARGTGRLAADGARVQIWTPDGGTALVDPASGEELDRWSERGIATLTPFGPALAVLGPELNIAPIPGCWGVWLEHPSLPEAECVLGAERALWSPDGSMLALLSDRGPFDRWLEFWTFGDAAARVLVPPTARLVEWSDDGRFLLVTWGFEMS